MDEDACKFAFKVVNKKQTFVKGEYHGRVWFDAIPGQGLCPMAPFADITLDITDKYIADTFVNGALYEVKFTKVDTGG